MATSLPFRRGGFFLALTLFSAIILSGAVSAIEFGISPEAINLDGNTGENICGNFSLIGDSKIVFNGSIAWSETNTKTISDYSLSSGSMSLKAAFPQEAGPGRYMLCVTGSKPGRYYGALFYKVESMSYGIGTWIYLNINGNEVDNYNYFTGSAIEDDLSRNGNSLNYYIILFMMVSLLIELAVLLMILMKGNKASSKAGVKKAKDARLKKSN